MKSWTDLKIDNCFWIFKRGKDTGQISAPWDWRDRQVNTGSRGLLEHRLRSRNCHGNHGSLARNLELKLMNCWMMMRHCFSHLPDSPSSTDGFWFWKKLYSELPLYSKPVAPPGPMVSGFLLIFSLVLRSTHYQRTSAFFCFLCNPLTPEANYNICAGIQYLQ